MRATALLLILLVPQNARRPEPSEAERKAALKTIQDVFKEEYSKKAPDDRRRLGRKLLEQAAGTKDDPPSEYTLLQESRRLCAETGDIDTALKAIGELSRRFEIDPLPLRSATLAAAAQTAKTPEDQSACALQYLGLSEAAARALDLAVAEKALSSASTLAKNAKNVALVARIDAKSKQLAGQKSKLAAVKKAQETLAKDPGSAEANGIVGAFVAFTQDDWVQGLPLLAKGPASPVKDAAVLDLANPTEPARQSEVGDAWWTLSESVPEEQRKAVRRRASIWYDKARPGLAGLAKAKVEKRLAEFPAPEVSVPADADPAAAERWNPVPPLTLISKQTTMKEALGQLIQESGIPVSLGDVDSSTKLALKIENMGFAGALETLCRAGGVAYTWNEAATDILLTRSKWLETAYTSFGPFVLIGRVGKMSQDPNLTSLILYFDWDPTVKPVWYEVSLESMTSEAGTPVQVTYPAGTSLDRSLGMRFGGAHPKYNPRREYQRDLFHLEPAVPVGKKLLSVRGRVDVYLPLKWSRIKFENAGLPARQPAGEFEVELSWSPPKDGYPGSVTFSLELAKAPVQKRFPLYGASLEAKVRFLDPKGKEIGAEPTGGSGGRGLDSRDTFVSGNRRWTMKGVTEPPKVSEIELVSDVWVRSYTFELRDVPHPALPNR